MILGLSTASFTLFHVIISLIGIGSGAVVVGGMLQGRRLPTWNALFLLTTVATSVTGFLFHSAKFGPPHVLGVLSLIALTVAIAALYGFHLAGRWRASYVVAAILSLYFNAFVAVVQSFDKIGFLHPLAPTGTEPPFLLAQAVVLALFVWLTARALKHFRPAAG